MANIKLKNLITEKNDWQKPYKEEWIEAYIKEYPEYFSVELRNFTKKENVRKAAHILNKSGLDTDSRVGIFQHDYWRPSMEGGWGDDYDEEHEYLADRIGFGINMTMKKVDKNNKIPGILQKILKIKNIVRQNYNMR